MRNTKRDFKGVWISKAIWENHDLSPLEKVMIVEIDSLDNENGCYASNAHFSKFFNLSKGRISQLMKSLESRGYISIELEREGNRITKRVVRILTRGSENIKQGVVNILNGSNTVIEGKSIVEEKSSDFSDTLIKDISCVMTVPEGAGYNTLLLGELRGVLDDYQKTAVWLWQHIHQLYEDKTTAKAKLGPWAREIRILIERDKYCKDIKEFCDVYWWVYNDRVDDDSRWKGWAENIRSAKKFRDQFPKVKRQYLNSKKTSTAKSYKNTTLSKIKN